MTIGLSDILSTQQNGVAALRDLSTALGSGGAFSNFMGGSVTGLNSLSTTAIQAVGANAARLNLTFHNPGTVAAYVYPNIGATGMPLTPSTSALGGAFTIFPGAFLTVVDGTNGAWSAFSASGSNNPLTVMDRS
jgi:hypothetical protein